MRKRACPFQACGNCCNHRLGQKCQGNAIERRYQKELEKIQKQEKQDELQLVLRLSAVNKANTAKGATFSSTFITQDIVDLICKYLGAKETARLSFLCTGFYCAKLTCFDYYIDKTFLTKEIDFDVERPVFYSSVTFDIDTRDYGDWETEDKLPLPGEGLGVEIGCLNIHDHADFDKPHIYMFELSERWGRSPPEFKWTDCEWTDCELCSNKEEQTRFKVHCEMSKRYDKELQESYAQYLPEYEEAEINKTKARVDEAVSAFSASEIIVHKFRYSRSNLLE